MAAFPIRPSRAIAEAVKEAGITHFIHISTIGARENSHSAYAHSKAEGEAAVHEHVAQAIIFRPSIVSGFRGRHHTGGSARPRRQGDPWASYELAGPGVKTFREPVEYFCGVIGRRRQVIPLSFESGKLMASATNCQEVVP